MQATTVPDRISTSTPTHINNNSSNDNPPTDSHNSVITIPNDLPLSDTERSLLSKGLSFVPVSKHIDSFQTLCDVEQFFRRLRLRAFFHNKPDTRTDSPDVFSSLSHKRSNWIPPRGLHSALDHYIDTCRRQIHSFDLNKPCQTTNLSNDEINALKTLRKRTDIVIKPADKGGAVVVWSRDLYTQEGLKQLSDTRFYTPTSNDMTDSFHTEVNSIISSAIHDNDLPSTATSLFSVKPRTSKLYLLPKIHKPDNPGRPIVSACNCPTEQIANLLTLLTSDIVASLPSFLKDTTHAISTFTNFSFNSDNQLIFTGDIKSLYTHVPNDDGLTALRHFLSRRPTNSPPTDILIRLAELVLTRNSFTFHGQFFIQSLGVAMGSRFGPNFACLFIGYLELQIFSSYPGNTPDLYKRFIDDVSGATDLPRHELVEFLTYVNNFHPSIDYTWTISDTSLSFLDLKLTIQDNSITTSIYYKPTDAHSYLLYDSSHPPNTKKAIPYSQLLRLRRICQNNSDFHQRLDDCLEFFRSRGYPDSILNQAKSRALRITWEQAMTPTTVNRQTNTRTPLVITYHQRNKPVVQTLLNNFNILRNDPDTSAIFTSPPVLAYRRDKNLRDQLVHSSLRPLHNTTPTSSPGTLPCNRPRCKTCPYTHTVSSITGPKGRISIHNSFNCTSQDVIYVLSCLKCNCLYVGETKRLFSERFREHLRDIRLHNDTPVADHFCSPGHDVTRDLRCTVIRYNTRGEEERKRLERRIIYNLGTLHPNGMNLDFHFG